MGFRAIGAAAFAALWITSCGGQTAAPSASPSPFEFKGTPSGLVLRESDLPDGFHVHYESAIGPFEVAELLTTDSTISAAAADALLKKGLASSYGRTFDSGASTHNGIASIVMVYRDRASAQEAVELLFGYARDMGCFEIPVAMTIGDMSKACAQQVQYQDNTNGSDIYLYFSILNAVAYIGIADDPSANDGQLIADLALRQIKLMRSFGDPELKMK